MTDVLRLKASKRDVRDALRQLPDLVAGRNADAGDAVRGLMLRLGMVALGRIKTAFVEKARGGADESGLKWQPLKSSTVAYNRRHLGVPPAKKRAPDRPSWMLTEKQRARWWQLNAIGGAAFAWRTIKAEGGKTLISEYGNTPVEILRDTGQLLNSLSPGSGSPEQILRPGYGEVTVGTNRKWAACHHKGIPGKLPQRRLWPSPENWPQAWWDELLAEMRTGLIEVALFLMRRAQR